MSKLFGPFVLAAAFALNILPMLATTYSLVVLAFGFMMMVLAFIGALFLGRWRNAPVDKSGRIEIPFDLVIVPVMITTCLAV